MGLLLLLTASASAGAAASSEPSVADREAALAGLAADSQVVFRGRCLEAIPTEREVAGARLAATRYTFEVLEWMKGGASAGRWQFTQVGRPAGGPADLGTLAGLPVYQPGQEYVLFLLPPGRSGMTSPAGAGEAAFAVGGSDLLQIGGRHGWRQLPRPGAPLTLERTRAILGTVGR